MQRVKINWKNLGDQVYEAVVSRNRGLAIAGYDSENKMWNAHGSIYLRPGCWTVSLIGVYSTLLEAKYAVECALSKPLLHSESK